MGVRANLFEETRKCVNVLKGCRPSRIHYDENFPKSIMSVTRRHLRGTALNVIDSLEKETLNEIPSQLQRYYKLSALHMSQLKRYTKYTKKMYRTEKELLEQNIIYLQKLSFMISKIFKNSLQCQCQCQCNRMKKK
eukprot:scaffold16543_cov76-Phaeocystis_antarctica.AAC.6